MPYNGYENGLYLVTQEAIKNGISITHYGVLDIGNKIKLPFPKARNRMPMIIHQTPPRALMQPLDETGEWKILGKVVDEHEASAIKRIHEALEQPEYDLFGNNCEHFARFIATGARESIQLQKVFVTAALIVVAGWVISKIKT